MKTVNSLVAKALVVFLLFPMIASAQSLDSTVEYAFDEWNFPSMSREETEFMQDKANYLNEQFTLLMDQYGNALEPNDQFRAYGFLGSGFVLNMHTEWESFAFDMEACDSAEKFIKILHSEYIGINKLPDEAPLQEILPVFLDLLEDASLNQVYYHACHFEDEDGSWICRAGGALEDADAPYSFYPFVAASLTQNGKVKELGVLRMPEGVHTEPIILTSPEEARRILDEAHGFVDQWAFHPQTHADSAIVIQSAQTYQYGRDTEALLGIWIYRYTETALGVTYVFDEQNFANVGTMITIGQKSGRVYQFTSNTVFSAMENTELFVDGTVILDSIRN